VLVVDDQTLFRQALAELLSAEPRLSVAGEAEDGEDAVRKVDALLPDVVLMDVVMPRLDGIRATARIKREHPRVRVLMLASGESDESVVEAMRAGAQGYIHKDTDRESLVAGILQAMEGRHVLPATGQRAVVAAALDRVAVQIPPGGLSRRQFEVLRLMSLGLAFKQIGRALGLSDKTVRNQASLIYSKLKVHDRAGAILYALHKGFGA
jgi:DNA-binding NarL/FixJ family response regulator